MKKHILILNEVKRLLGQDVKLESMTLDNGTVIEAEVFEAGAPVFIVTEEEPVPLPVGDYTMEDGRVLVVAEEGLIAEIKEAEASEEVVEDVEASREFVTKEDFLAAIGEIKSMFTAQLDAKAKEVKKVEMSAEDDMPAATAIKPNPERETAQGEQIKFSQNRKQSIEDKMMAKFSNLKLS